MGLMLARDAFFARQGHSIQQDGLPGDIRKYKVLCSENALSLIHIYRHPP